MHVLGLDWLRRGMHSAHPMKPFYLTWAYLSINAWVWSAVFHTRGAYFLPTPSPFRFIRSHTRWGSSVDPFYIQFSPFIPI
jgi:hypothetical protein